MCARCANGFSIASLSVLTKGIEDKMTKIVEVGPELTPLALRVIQKSAGASYPKYIGARRIGADWLRDEISAWVRSPRGRVLIAFDKGNPVGVLATLRHFRSLELGSLFVTPQAAFKGLGSALFLLARIDARARNMRMYIEVLARNRACREFCERRNGILMQRRPSRWGDIVVYGWN